MHYRPGLDARPLPYDPFKSCTVPRPIGWLSTVDAEGRANLAPYSQWQNVTFDPPMVMFAANVTPDGRRKDTVLNAEETGWFVWNMATWDLREAVNISAMELPKGEDEFLKAGVTKAPCIDAPGPRVAESPCHFEVKWLTTTRFPGGKAGPVDVVFGEVKRIHVRDDVVTAEGRLDIPKIRPIARMGYYDYTVVTETFEMRIPGASAAVADGLEGRS
ncbi:MAG: flavin reductase family protein [Pikeienuella sp.]|uniref:flavin reductase family protein n=1 Tax=Pikeienuella sp. TaxID=2831957 RepID=UPI0039189F73